MTLLHFIRTRATFNKFKNMALDAVQFVLYFEYEL